MEKEHFSDGVVFSDVFQGSYFRPVVRRLDFANGRRLNFLKCFKDHISTSSAPDIKIGRHSIRGTFVASSTFIAGIYILVL